MAKKDDDLGFVADDEGGFQADDTADELGFEPDAPEKPSDKLKRAAMLGLGGAGKALDYVRGATTAPLAALALEAKTGKDVFRGREYLDALNPLSMTTYPGMGELAERAGVPAGGKVSDVFPSAEGRFYDASLRGAGGAVADAAIDPLSWLSMGTSGALKTATKEGAQTLAQRLGKAISSPVRNLPTLAKAPSNTVAKIGRSLYSMGIRPLEQAGERRGKDEVINTLRKYKVAGSARRMAEQVDDAADVLKTERDAILDAADAAGATVPREEAFKPFLDELDGLVADSRMSREEADRLKESVIGTYMAREGEPGARLATQWKTDLDSKLPATAYDATKTPGISQRLQKGARKGLKEGVENSVGRATGAEAAAELATKNADLGDLLTIRPQALNYAQLQERLRLLGHLEVGGAVGMGMLADPTRAALFLGAKKALDVGRMPALRTRTGLSLWNLGEGKLTSPLLDIGTRRGAVDLLKRRKNGEE